MRRVLTSTFPLLSSFLLCLTLLTATYAQPHGETTKILESGSNMELSEIFYEDQAIRGEDFFEGDLEAKAAADRARRQRVRSMLDEGLVRTGNDFWRASLILQHGEKPEDYLLAHILANVAAQKGNVNAPWLSAATLDRYLNSVGQPQVFGTQYYLRDLGDKKTYTQDPIDESLISDSLRAEFKVPDTETRAQALWKYQNE